MAKTPRRGLVRKRAHHCCPPLQLVRANYTFYIFLLTQLLTQLYHRVVAMVGIYQRSEQCETQGPLSFLYFSEVLVCEGARSNNLGEVSQ